MYELTKEQDLLIKFPTISFSEIPEDIKWNNFLSLSLKQKVFPVIYPKIISIIPEKYLELTKELFDFHQRRVKHVISELEKINQVSKENNLEFLLLKGVSYSEIIYKDVFSRHCGDIDLLIHENDILQFDKILRENSWFHACGKNKNAYKIDKKGVEILPFPILKDFKHHEYFEYYKNNISLEVGRFIHSTIQEKSINDFLKQKEEIKIGNSLISTFNLNYLFLYIIENIYTDSEYYYGNLRVKEYYDLYYFLKRYATVIDWDYISYLADKYKIKDIMIRVIENFEELYPNFIRVKGFFNKNSGVEVESNNLLFNWKSSFKQRLFNNHLRRKEIDSLIEQKVFGSDKYQLEYDKGRKRSFQDEKYFFNTYYSIDVHNEELIFNFTIDEILFNSLDKFNLIIKITAKKENYLISDDIKINRINNKFVIKSNITDVEVSENYNNSKKYSFEIKIKVKKMFKQNSKRNSIKVSYNIILQENIYKNIFHNIGSKYPLVWSDTCLSPGIICINNVKP